MNSIDFREATHKDLEKYKELALHYVTSYAERTYCRVAPALGPLG